MKHKSRIKLLGIIIFALIPMFQSCRLFHNLSNENLSDIYAENKLLQVETMIFHESDSFSKIYYRFYIPDLIYKKNDYGTYVARYRINTLIYNDFNSKTLIDSTSYSYEETDFFEQKRYLIGSIKVKAVPGKKSVVKFIFIDRNARRYSVDLLVINRSNNYNEQHFLLTNSSGTPLFRKTVLNNESFTIRCGNQLTKQLYVEHYKKVFPAAAPPHQQVNNNHLDLEPDTGFYVSFKNGCTSTLIFNARGLYHIRRDTTQEYGFSFMNYGASFPRQNTAEEMLDQLRYLTTNKEFEIMLNSADKKKSLDQFWLQNAGSPDRAREMIKNYYTRTLFANQRFTSYLEGWKTDRGMIYIIFGPPFQVNKYLNKEIWIYQFSNSNTANFIFVKAENPLCENDYFLNRTSIYKPTWFNAVDIWRR